MTEQESILWVSAPTDAVKLWTAAVAPGKPWVALGAFAEGTAWAGPIALPRDLTAKKKAP